MSKFNFIKNNFWVPILGITIFIQCCGHKKELKEFGVVTTAIVKDGQSYKRNNVYYYNLKVEYKTESGKLITKELPVDKAEFEAVYADCEIPLIYSTKNPERMALLLDDKEVLNYIGIKNKQLGIGDLCKLLEYPKPDSLFSHLNKISYKWLAREADGMPFFENIHKREIVLNRFGILYYNTKSTNIYSSLDSKLQDEGFILIERDSTGAETFQKDSIEIQYSKEQEYDENSDREISHILLVSKTY